MKNETVLSTGIDIGTTTTHLIVSRLGICETGGFGVVPSVEITSKEILYKSPVYFTPLLENGDLDLQGVALRIQKEYDRAGIAPSDLKCGAVIITGESPFRHFGKFRRFCSGGSRQRTGILPFRERSRRG